MTIAAEFNVLKTAAEKGSDEDLIDYLKMQEGGIDGVLERTFGVLPAVFNAQKAGRTSAEFQYHILTPDDIQHYFVRVVDGECTSGKGEVEDPQVTLKAPLTVFVRMLTGEVNGMRAFLTRKVQISGSIFFAAKFETWFDRPV
jgi:putative sterol carrier protein